MRAGSKGLVVALGVLSLALGLAAWLVSPGAREWRLSRADLVTLGREADQHPADGRAWFYLGSRLRERGASLEAIGALRRAQQLRPNDTRVRVALGWALLDGNEIEEAFQLAKSAVGTAPEATDPRELLARLYQRTGAYHKAEAEWRWVLGREPRNDRAWYFLAFCYLQMQQVDRAKEAADRSLALAPRTAAALRLRASIAAAAGDLADARDYYERAIRESPQDPRSHHDLANFLLTQKVSGEDVGRAEEALSRLRALEPHHPLIPWHEARIAIAREQWPEAVRLLESVRRSTPALNEAAFQLAGAYHRLGRKREGDAAMAAYREQSELQRRIDELRIRRELEDRPGLLFQLAALERKAGLYDDADRSVRAGLRLNPESPVGKAELKAIGLARAAGGR